MNILIFAPHRDDEILGVGGTILKRVAKGDRVTVCIVTSSKDCQLSEAGAKYTAVVQQEMEEAHRFCGVDHSVGLPFMPVILETYPRAKLNQEIFNVIEREQPEEVYLPFWGDMQKDHRVVTDAAMVALRSKYNHPVKRIYAYETLSETGINRPNPENTFIPNVYVDISDYLEGKKKALSFFKSQVAEFPDLRSVETTEALAKFRGATINVKAAEAFMLIREVK